MTPQGAPPRPQAPASIGQPVGGAATSPGGSHQPMAAAWPPTKPRTSAAQPPSSPRGYPQAPPKAHRRALQRPSNSGDTDPRLSHLRSNPSVEEAKKVMASLPYTIRLQMEQDMVMQQVCPRLSSFWLPALCWTFLLAGSRPMDSPFSPSLMPGARHAQNQHACMQSMAFYPWPSLVARPPFSPFDFALLTCCLLQPAGPAKRPCRTVHLSFMSVSGPHPSCTSLSYPMSVTP